MNMSSTKLKTLVATCFVTTSIALSNLVILTSASHFRGGIISWRPLEQPNGNLTTDFLPMIEISVRVAWRRSSNAGHSCKKKDILAKNLLPGEGFLSCSCNGLDFVLSYYCTDFSETEDWSTGINFGQYKPTSPVFDVWFSGCCWIYLQNSDLSWNLGTSVNLTTRSDNGLINSSPKTSSLPEIRFYRGCNNTVKIPVSDPDGDFIRCFWATKRCAGICGALPNTNLDENTCVLTWYVDETSSLGLYGVAIEIVDFESPTSSNALSYIPLQFLIDVVSSDHPCSSQPIFIPPTRLPGSCVGVPRNTTFYEPVVARAGSPLTSITDVDTVTPIGVEKSDIFSYPDGLATDYYLTVTWTPQTIGVEEIFCFIARSSVGYDSTQHCFTLVTGTPPPLILDRYLQPANKGLVLPSELAVKLKFDQDIVRPHRRAMISLVGNGGVLVYEVDAGDPQKVSFIGDREIAFIIPDQLLEERATYRIHMDSGVVKSTTFCGVESPKIVDDFWTFTVRDITPPELQVNPISPWTNENVTISWTLNEEANTTCTVSSPTETKVDPCDGFWTGTLLSEGYHTFNISATDTAGNTGSPQQISWFVDKTPPDLIIYEQPSELTNETNATFSFRCTDHRDSCQFICGYSSVDKEPDMEQCSSPFIASGLLNNRQYKFSVVALDSVGNRANKSTVTWVVVVTTKVTTTAAESTPISTTAEGLVTASVKETTTVEETTIANGATTAEETNAVEEMTTVEETTIDEEMTTVEEITRDNSVAEEYIFVNSSYIFNSPNYPSYYPNNFRFTWYFSTDPGSQLLVTFSAITTERNSDYIYVLEGNYTLAMSHLLLRWSGIGSPNKLRILSSENIIWVTFESDWSVTHNGFMATVEVTNMTREELDCGTEFDCKNGVCLPQSRVCDKVIECGEHADEKYGPCGEYIFVNSSYIFNSPNYPSNYPNNVEYTWYFSTDPGSRLLVTFSAISTERDYDYIDVREGSNTLVLSYLLLRWSGAGSPDELRILSSEHFIWVKFESDGSVTYNGFMATVKVTNMTREELNCGTEFHCKNGVCLSQSRVCDGERDCGNNADERFGNCAAQEEVTALVEETTAAAEMTTVEGTTLVEEMTTVEETTRDNSVAEEYIFVNSSYIFSLPNYPSDYPNNFEYKWFFSTDPGSHLLVTFNAISTERGSDYIDVREGSTTSALSHLLLRWSGTGSPDELRILSSENFIWVTFESDWIVTYNGFVATVEVTNMTREELNCETEFDCKNGVCLSQSRVCDGERECGNNADERYGDCAGTCESSEFSCDDGECIAHFHVCDEHPDCFGGEDEFRCHGTEYIFVNSSYIFNSPNYPSNYPNNVEYTWYFSTDPGFQLLVTFSAISTERDFDYIYVKEGSYTSALSYLLLRWSGTESPDELRILSSENFIWVTFESDGSITYNGFVATVEVTNMTREELNCGTEFDCRNGVCLSQSRVCDGERECGNNADERNGNCSGTSS